MQKTTLPLIFLFSYIFSFAQFSTGITLTEEGTPRNIASGDFNQDGFVDFVYASDNEVGTAALYIVLNDGTGNFLPPSFVITDIDQGYSVGVGDLNEDGILDLATQGETWFEFNWYTGNGDGTFSTANIITSSIGGVYVTETVIFDLDADGHQDIVIVDQHSSVFPAGFVGWYKNNGNGNIDTLALIFSDLVNPFSLAFGDLDGDIYPDVVVGKKAPEPVFIFEYDGAGSFSYEAMNASSMEHGAQVFIEDMDGDGLDDILATEASLNKIRFWKNQGFGNWTNQLTLVSATSGIIGGMSLADITADGKPDVVYSTLGGEVGYYPNVSTAAIIQLTFPEILGEGINVSRNLVVLDSDNDQDLDIIVTSQQTSSTTGNNKITYFRNFANDASMSGNVFFDENENGILESNENLLPNFPIEVTPSAFAVFTNDDGGFRIFGDAGTYELTPQYGGCWGASGSTNFTIDFDGVNPVEDILIATKQISNAENVQVNLTSAPTRCGFTVPFWMNYTNTGCQTIDGKIQLVQSSLTTLISTNTPPDQTISDTLIWNFENLFPGENRQVDLTFEVAGVQFLGDTISVPLQFLKENPDGSFTQIDESIFTSIINCAYDPNDKQTYPRRSEIEPYDENYTLMNERMDYTIRFQNTGTDTAFNIVIRDTLSTDLDWTTFRPLSASHDFETIFHEDGAVEFFFENILLVDSFSNEPMSHGYVQFSIHANDNLLDATSIFNSASIYFDFNPPILTNTVENIMVEMLPVFTSTQNDFITKQLQLFPNPVEIGENLVLNNLMLGEKRISVFNSLGQVVFREKTADTFYEIKNQNWKAGVYVVLVENENQTMVGKVIVE